MSTAPVAPDNRWTAQSPCPICDGHQRLPRGQGTRCSGYLGGDEQNLAFCSREEKAGALPADAAGLYPHRLRSTERHPCPCGAVHGGFTWNAEAKRIEAVFDYREPDGSGRVRFQTVKWRLPGGVKDFSQRVPDPTARGGYRWKVRGVVEPLPYRVDELLRAAGGSLVVVEGEKDCDRLWALGLLATTDPGWAKWGRRPELAVPLAERFSDVVVVVDHDREGEKRAQGAARAFLRLGCRVRVLRVAAHAGRDLELVPKGYDLSDWLDEQGSAAPERLRQQLEQAPLWQEYEAVVPPSAQGNGNGNGNGHHDNNGNGNGNGNGHEEAELRDTVPLIPSFTDVQNARRYVERFGEERRYDETHGRWRVYREGVWRLDMDEQAMRDAKEVVAHLYDEIPAPDAIHPDLRDKLVRSARACESTGRLKALLENAQSELAITHEQLDADPYLLNCVNGTIDLHTGELLPHDPRRLQSKSCAVPYEPDRPCPQWLAFLDRVFADDQELIAWLQRAIGISLIGSVLEHVLFVMYGGGGNGKSTWIETWLGVLGDYAKEANPYLFVETMSPQHPAGIADLMGARFVSTAETAAGDGRRGNALNETLVKNVTGGDIRSARFMRENFFTYVPSDTVWLSTNHKPTIHSNSDAIWRRVRLIPFTVKIPPADDVKDYARSVLVPQEGPAILAWAVRGTVQYLRQHGLGTCAAVTGATAQYRNEMDTLAAFLDDYTLVCERPYTAPELCLCGAHDHKRQVWDDDGPATLISHHPGQHGHAEAAKLFETYQEWCQKSGERPPTQRLFNVAMGERGFSRRAMGPGRRTYWCGLHLLDANDAPQDPETLTRSTRRESVPPAAPVQAVFSGDAFDTSGVGESRNRYIADPGNISRARTREGSGMSEEADSRARAHTRGKDSQTDSSDSFDLTAEPTPTPEVSDASGQPVAANEPHVQQPGAEPGENLTVGISDVAPERMRSRDLQFELAHPEMFGPVRHEMELAAFTEATRLFMARRVALREEAQRRGVI